MLIKLMRDNLKLWLLFLASLTLSFFSAYNSVNYGLINPGNPTRIPTEIAYEWIRGMQFLAFIFGGLSIMFLYLIIKRSRKNNEN